MKVQLDFVQFADNVKGPGPLGDGPFSSFNGSYFVSIHADDVARKEAEARGRAHNPKPNVVDIVHDTEGHCIILSKPGATKRPVVRVPWSMVHYAEQTDLERATAPTAKK